MKMDTAMIAITGPRAGDRVTVKVSAYWLRRVADGGKGLFGRVIEGEIVAASNAAFRIRGAASTAESRSCHRCGRDITHPYSLLVGYGPTCSAILGVDWGNATDADVERIRAEITRQTQIEMWFPLQSSTFLALDRPAEVPTVAQTPPPSDLPGVVIDTCHGAINVASPYSHFYENVQIARSIIGGRWDPARQVWTYPQTPEFAQLIWDAWRRQGIIPQASKNFWALRDAAPAYESVEI